MRITVNANGQLEINGLIVLADKAQSASVYHQLFMLYMTALGREYRTKYAADEVIKEAENLLKGEDE
jgi:hypothetical protein